MIVMRFVFGIDVSKDTSNIACALDGEVISQFKITNDNIGFSKLLENLQATTLPEIVFESTGIYSRRLCHFLDNHAFQYCLLNPLLAKKQLDGLRPNKTDKNDAANLAKSHFILNRAVHYKQDPIFQDLMDYSRFYQQINEDVVRDKNRLHRALQVSFPNIEDFVSHPRGQLYWNVLSKFPTPNHVLSTDIETLPIKINECTAKNMSMKRREHLANRLVILAKVAYQAISNESPMIGEIQYYAKELLRLDKLKENIIDRMVMLAKQLPDFDILMSIPGIGETTAVSLLGELGDIRRFSNSNKINAFIGIDLRHYESGNVVAADRISKRGNPVARKILYRSIGNIASAGTHTPTHINDFYQQRKKQSSQQGTKKIAIATMHRLIRTIYHLIITNQTYDYLKTKSSKLA